MNGTIRRTNYLQCNQSLFYNVVWDSPGTAYDSYYNNLTQSRSCTDHRYAINGRMYIGDHGYVDIQTPTPLLTGMTYIGDLVNGELAILDGSIRLFNAMGQYLLSVGPGQGINDPAVANLKIYVGQSLQTDVTFLSWYLSHEVLSDISDSDSDGMLDGWERYYGLTVGIDDSQDDMDGDGFSNHAEFKGYFNPTDATQAPHLKLSSSLHYSGPVDGNGIRAEVGQSLSFDVNVHGSVAVLAADEFGSYRLEVQLPSLGQWTYDGQDGCQVDRSGDAVFVCPALPLNSLVAEEDDIKTIKVATLTLTSESAGNATLVVQTETDLGVEEYLNSIEFSILASSYFIEPIAYVQAHALDDDEFINLVIGQHSEGVGIPASIVVSGSILSAPPGLSFSHLNAGAWGLYDCQFSEQSFSCKAGSADAGLSVGSFKISMTSPSQIGEAQIAIQIDTTYPSGKVISKTAQSRQVFGYPTTSLQEMINAATSEQPGSTVTLPDGVYVGQLAISNGHLRASDSFHLWATNGPYYSADGLDNANVYISYGSSLAGGNYHVFGESFVGAGNISIRDVNIESVNGAFTMIELSGDALIENSRFRTVQSSQYSVASGFIEVLSSGVGVTIRNSLFIADDGLGTMVMDNSTNGAIVKLLNNTGIGLGALLSSANAGAVCEFVNNVLADDVEAQVSLTSGTGSCSVVNASSNLLPAALSLIGGSNNIYTDIPMLDPETFAPLPGSPAIDAGADLSAEFTTDLLGNPRPVGAGFDIGAIEVQAP